MTSGRHGHGQIQNGTELQRTAIVTSYQSLPFCFGGQADCVAGALALKPAMCCCLLACADWGRFNLFRSSLSLPVSGLAALFFESRISKSAKSARCRERATLDSLKQGQQTLAPCGKCHKIAQGNQLEWSASVWQYR